MNRDTYEQRLIFVGPKKQKSFLFLLNFLFLLFWKINI